MKNSKKNSRMTWLTQVILLFMIISLSLILYGTLKQEYIKQQKEQELIAADST